MIASALKRRTKQLISVMKTNKIDGSDAYENQTHQTIRADGMPSLRKLTRFLLPSLEKPVQVFLHVGENLM